MTATELSALVLAVVATVATLAAVPPSPARRPLLAIGGTLIVVAVVVAVIGVLPDRPPPRTGEPGTGTPTASADPGPQRLAQVSLEAPRPLGATAYFGQLEEVIKVLAGTVEFKTDPDFRAQRPDLCVATVVFTGVPGDTAAVYARGMDGDWGGAEAVPDQRISPPDRDAHQQLVIPPEAAVAGRAWRVSAALDLGADGGHDAISGEYVLALRERVATTLTWTVNGTQTVACAAYG